MQPDQTITDLLERWLEGDEQAARGMFDRYAQRLTRLAEQQLSRKLAGRVDGEDIVQSVFRTFFVRSARGDFEINSSVELWQLLVKITLLKTRMQARRHTAGKRDVAAESGLSIEDWLPEAITREPGPDEAAALGDQIEHLLDGLPPDYGEILSLRLQGHARRDIAERMGVSRQTVYRALKLMQQRLERLQ